jgi:hypothetical protein
MDDMRVLIESTAQGGQVNLIEADDLRHLHVETQLTDPARIDAAMQAAGAGRLDEGAAWLDIEYLRARAIPADPLPHSDSFDNMIDFARARGWVSADGRQVQAHVVTKAQGE